ncbi:hypothetical protein GCM10010909_32540 [Acidocella aquatica]|uniref:Rieske domain-containing protein n=1 Tax=Acidocella aquatica TaxID=1922313 RepID=A0ABQ6AAH2_9PROT|nr:aromatic ring-hydroxylating dioxygenase subunit alpha [Acidocella aquatica]GLR68573.1 hypothetical protein GCM10010909_32540 [Acidocella aquatica]
MIHTDENCESPPGGARCPGLSYVDLLGRDTRPVPAFLRADRYRYLGSEPLDVDRYVNPDVFRAECEKMWPRVWQFAAREEELPDPGDYVVYENAGRSYLVTRQPDGSVRAFYNVCLHRGRKLRTEDGCAVDFKCPFHAFTWEIDGSLKDIPCRWDFGHLTAEKMQLPQATVARWGGYIFLREAEEGPGIEEYLDPLPREFARWDHAGCATTLWVGKVIAANWKAVLEAFIEAWHSLETHKQLLPFTGDANSAYHVLGEHVNLAITPFATPSPHLDQGVASDRWLAERLAEYNARPGDPVVPIELADGQSAREAVAELNRRMFQQQCGYDYTEASDAEMLDAFVYNVFPNFSPWGGHMPNIVYRFRPWPDHRATLMEVRFLRKIPAGEAHPRCPPMRLLGPGEGFAAVEALGQLGGVFDQDMWNLPQVQAGCEASKTGKIELGNYQEVRIRHFAQTMDHYLAG